MRFLTRVRRAKQTGLALFCLIAVAALLQPGCGKDKGTNPDPPPPPPPPPQPSASLGSCDADIDRNNDIITLATDVTLTGYAGRTFAMGGYWFRKNGDSYYYVRAGCQTNVPNNYLGRQWTVTASCDNSRADNVGFTASYGCFPERSGCYYGRIKLYQVGDIPCAPNSCTMTKTGYVELTWTTCGASNNGDAGEPSIRILNSAESEALNLLIESSGGLLRPGS